MLSTVERGRPTASKPCQAACRAPMLAAARRNRLIPVAALRSHYTTRRLVKIVHATASSSGAVAEIASVAAVEYTVGASTYACSRRAGTSGQLLRLVEQSEDSEYVVLVPAAVAGILHEVLESAVECLQSHASLPREVHHHMILGQRQFTCSMSYDSTSSSSNSSNGAAGHVVQVTVQEKGRSTVQLRVCKSALPAVNILMTLLQQAAAPSAATSAAATVVTNGHDSLVAAADDISAAQGAAAAAEAATLTSDLATAVDKSRHSNGSSSSSTPASVAYASQDTDGAQAEVSGRSPPHTSSTTAADATAADGSSTPAGTSSSSCGMAMTVQQKLAKLEKLADVAQKITIKSKRSRPATPHAAGSSSSSDSSSSGRNKTSEVKAYKFNTTSSSSVSSRQPAAAVNKASAKQHSDRIAGGSQGAAAAAAVAPVDATSAKGHASCTAADTAVQQPAAALGAAPDTPPQSALKSTAATAAEFNVAQDLPDYHAAQPGTAATTDSTTANSSSSSSCSSIVYPVDPSDQLLAEIMASKRLSEGLAFAHAAAAATTTSPTSTSSSSSSSGARSFSALDLVALWTQLPVYAVAETRDGLGVPEGQADPALELGGMLHPDVQEDIQEFVALLAPLLQPHLAELPLGMLELLLSSAAQVNALLPPAFARSWAAAAAASPEFHDLEDDHLIQITLALANVGQSNSSNQQQQGAGSPTAVLLPLEWAVPTLAAAVSRLQMIYQWRGNRHPGGCTAQELNDRVFQLVELAGEVLVACGEHMQRQQQEQQHSCAWTSSSSNSESDHCTGSIYSSLNTLFSASATDSPQLQSAAAAAAYADQQAMQQQQQPLSPEQHDQVHAMELQVQGALLEGIIELPGSQRSAVTELMWRWLVTGQGAQSVSSDSLLQLMQVLPYNAAAAAYAAASSSCSAGAPGQPASLMAKVLQLHGAAAATRRSGGSSSTSSSTSSSSTSSSSTDDAGQLSAVSDLLTLALQQDPQAAFAALPALLLLLATDPHGDQHHHHQQQQQQGDLDSLLMQFSNQILQMLQLDPQRVLDHGPLIAKTLSHQAAHPACTPQGLLGVLQLVLDLTAAAASWQQHVDHSLDLPDRPTAAAGSSDLAAETAAAALAAAPAWMVTHCESDSSTLKQQPGMFTVELLSTIAKLHSFADQNLSLAPAWVNPGSTAAAAAAMWQQGLGPVVQAALEKGSQHAAAQDLLLLAAALAELGVAFHDELGVEYLAAVAAALPELTMDQLCNALWIIAGLVISQQQQQQDVGSSGMTFQQVQVSCSDLTQLASQACAALCETSTAPAAGVDGSSSSIRQLARATWAVAALVDPAAAVNHLQLGSGSSSSPGQCCWSPPAQLWPWLQQTWAAAATAVASTAAASEQLGDIIQHVHQQLQPAEASDLVWSMQYLRLLPGTDAPDSSSSSGSSAAESAATRAAAAVVAQVSAAAAVQGSSSEPSEPQEHSGSVPNVQHVTAQHTAPACNSTNPTPAAATGGLAATGWPAATAAAQIAAAPDGSCSNTPAAWRPITTDLTLDSFFLDDFAGSDLGESDLEDHDLITSDHDESDVVDQGLIAIDYDSASSRDAAGEIGLQESTAAAAAEETPITAAISRTVEKSAAAWGADTAAAAAAVIDSRDAAFAVAYPAGPHPVVESGELAAINSHGSLHDTVAAAAGVTTPALETAAAAAAAAAETSKTTIAQLDNQLLDHHLEQQQQQPQQQLLQDDGENKLHQHQQGNRPTAPSASSNGHQPNATSMQPPVTPGAVTDSHSDLHLHEVTAPTPVAAAAAQLGSEPSEIQDVVNQLRTLTASSAVRPTRKEALQLLLPVQQQALTLSGPDLLLYVATCIDYRVQLPSEQLVAALQAAVDPSAAANAQPKLLLQLLSALAAAAAGGDRNSSDQWLQQVPELLQGVERVLTQQQMSRLKAEQIVQLLQDLCVLSSSSAGSGAQSSATDHSRSASSMGTAATAPYTAAPAPVCSSSQAWLSAAAAAAIQSKLLLLPHASSLIDALQCLQQLGLVNPGTLFLNAAYAAADALLDTFSARSVLELLAIATSASHMPSQQQTAALLQHLIPLKLSPADVASGMCLLAAIRIRPSAELLSHWYGMTEAAADRLKPSDILQILWACCQWQVLPPTQWLHSVIKGLIPAGRFSSCSPATAAGVCFCLWQLGVQPSPAFVTAVTSAAQHSIMTTAAAAAAGQQPLPGQMWDAESLSVLCFCLLMWSEDSLPVFNAAAAAQAQVVLPYADGPSLLRLGAYLTRALDSDEYSDEQGWQEVLMRTLYDLLPLSPDTAGEITIGIDGVAYKKSRLPFEALSTLYLMVLSPGSVVDNGMLDQLRRCVVYGAESELLTTWDIVSLVPLLKELIQSVVQDVVESGDQEAVISADQMCHEITLDMHTLIRIAYQQRSGAHSTVQEVIPRLAEDADLDMPAVSRDYLKASITAARQREQQLQDALLLAAEGGTAVPESLIEGLAEVAPEDGIRGLVEYVERPFSAAALQRFRRVGGCVSEEWWLKGMQRA